MAAVVAFIEISSVWTFTAMTGTEYMGGGVPGGLSVPALIGKLQKKLAEQMTDKIENIT